MKSSHQVWLVPGSLAAVALAGVPGAQPPQSVLRLLLNAGSAQHGVQRPAVNRHVLRHLRVRVGELHKLHCCRELRHERSKVRHRELSTFTRVLQDLRYLNRVKSKTVNAIHSLLAPHWPRQTEGRRGGSWEGSRWRPAGRQQMRSSTSV